jgi:transposase
MGKKKRPKEGHGVTRAKGPVPFEMRLRIVREVLPGAHQADVATAFGVSVAAVGKYLQRFRQGGVDALRGGKASKPVAAGAQERRRGVTSAPDPLRAWVVAVRQEHEDWGTRRIRDTLARFAGLGISETTVRRILHEEGLLVDAPPERGIAQHGVPTEVLTDQGRQ